VATVMTIMAGIIEQLSHDCPRAAADEGRSSLPLVLKPTGLGVCTDQSSLSKRRQFDRVKSIVGYNLKLEPANFVGVPYGMERS
jgi:hypothetical protein